VVLPATVPGATAAAAAARPAASSKANDAGVSPKYGIQVVHYPPYTLKGAAASGAIKQGRAAAAALVSSCFGMVVALLVV
jgi:hypothetical protein